MSIKLTLFFSGRLVNTYDFDDSHQVITIGRNPDCSIPIDNLGVSRIHCQIERRGPGLYTVVDMNSNNGTFVRGERVNSHNLNDGDEFSLGKHSVRFQNLSKVQEVATAPPPPQKFEDSGGGGMTMLVDSSEMEQLARERASKLSAYLVFTTETGLKQKVPILKTATFFGSHTGCEYCLKGWGVNYKHALVIRDEVGYRLINLVQKKGVLLNGQEIDDSRLTDGDRFRIAKYDYQFFVGSPT